MTSIQPNLSIATIEGNSEKGSIRQGVLYRGYGIYCQISREKNLIRVYNPHQLLTRSCRGQMCE
jgi:hypothetical protein